MDSVGELGEHGVHQRSYMFWILQMSSAQEEQGRKRQLDKERQRARLTKILGAKPVASGSPGQGLEKAGPGAQYQKVAEIKIQRTITKRPSAPPGQPGAQPQTATPAQSQPPETTRPEEQPETPPRPESPSQPAKPDQAPTAPDRPQSSPKPPQKRW